ncbi:ferredoxin [Acidithiobacillus ferrivorans SS3]|uniref:Ferredoxin n=1 Tax=Acidithiobacillus ferrivorans SS3 TaxID=743299 RepID=G0JP41_9PROT|nr:iron-sulfur cluster-binding domain-containing protein [Acidithiobacillus ferrivorans]AEM48456.1 ferredoxin [Acidithiobacillus ferrivorans SS3]
MDEITVTVKKIYRITHTFVIFVLCPKEGNHYIDPEPGSIIGVKMWDGIIVPYSVFSLPGYEACYCIAVRINYDGEFSKYFITIGEGENLYITGPVQSFYNRNNTGYIFIAGGVGITPFISMAKQLDDENKKYHIYFSGRNKDEDCIFDISMIPRDRVTSRYSDSDLPRLNIKTILNSGQAGYGFYCCGPESMINDFEESSTSLNICDAYVENFKKDKLTNDRQFNVHLKKSDAIITVKSDESITQALRRSGFNAFKSVCGVGVCGACETKIIDGVPDHRDSILTSKERLSGDVMMICCSRSKTEVITLDL